MPVPENEANLGALAEYWEAEPGAETFVYVSAEAGIGAALIVDGQLFRGARGFAGELGHIPVHPDSAPSRKPHLAECYSGSRLLRVASNCRQPDWQEARKSEGWV